MFSRSPKEALSVGFGKEAKNLPYHQLNHSLPSPIHILSWVQLMNMLILIIK